MKYFFSVFALAISLSLPVRAATGLSSVLMTNLNQRSFTVDLTAAPTNMVKLNLKPPGSPDGPGDIWTFMSTNVFNLWTNESLIYRPTQLQVQMNVTNLISANNLTASGGFLTDPSGESLALGANCVSIAYRTYIRLASLSNDPTLTTVQLQSGEPGKWLVLENHQSDGPSFTVVDDSAVCDIGGGHIRLAGDWTPSQSGETLELICNGTDWIERGRYNPNVPGGGNIAINPTDTHVPYRSSSTTFGDSPIVSSTNSLLNQVGIYYGNGASNYWNAFWSASGSGPLTNGEVIVGFNNIAGGDPIYHDHFLGTYTTSAATTGSYSRLHENATSSKLELAKETSGIGKNSIEFNAHSGLLDGVIGSFQTIWVDGSLRTSIRPGVANGTSAYFLDTGTSHSTGNLIEVANNGTNKFTVAALSGYTGAGTLFLSDDGTYKSAGGGGTTINPTDLYVPYRSSSTTFGDSRLLMDDNGPTHRMYFTNSIVHGTYSTTGAGWWLNGDLLQSQNNIANQVQLSDPYNLHGLSAYNVATSSASNPEQSSPSVAWIGQGWNTNAAANREVGFGSQVVVHATNNEPSGVWTLTSHINGTVVTNATVSSASGWAGAGTKALTDDGTFKTFSSSGPVTTSGLTMSTGKLLGRTTAGTGAIEELTVGNGLNLSSGVLSATIPTSAAYASTITDDFSTAGDFTTLLTGSTTIAASNQSNGRGVVHEFFNSASTNVNIILPSTWAIQVGAVTNILAPLKSATLSMKYYSFITNTVALWSSE